MPFTHTFLITTPLGSDFANQLDTYIRSDTKAALNERYNLEHYDLETGNTDPDDPQAQGRHIPGKVGCLFFGDNASRTALVGSGEGSIAYDTDEKNFYYRTAGGAWAILAINSDTVFADDESLEFKEGATPGQVDTLGMKRDNQQWVTSYDVAQPGWDPANPAIDCDKSNTFYFTAAQAFTISNGNVTNYKDGATYIIRIKQDAIGSRLGTFGTIFQWPGGVAPTLSTDPNALDIIYCTCDGSNLLSTIIYDVKN
jgi:hypothetical protein